MSDIEAVRRQCRRRLAASYCSSKAANDGGKSNVAERHRLPFYGRTGTLERRRDVKRRTWYLRLYLKEEKKYYRKALDSTDLEQAKDEARVLMAGVLQKLRVGESIISFSLTELRRRFLLHQEQLVRCGDLAQRTYQQQCYYLENGYRFVQERLACGMDTKLSGFNGKLFKHYLEWRMRFAEERGRNISVSSIRSELLSIRKMFKFASQQDWCSDTAIPRWDIGKRWKRAKRRRLTDGDAEKVSELAQASIGGATNPRDRYIRQLRLSVLRLMAACGLRTGEAFALRNSDIEIRDPERECRIAIREETTKVRKERVFLLRPTRDITQMGVAHNWLLEWINKYQRHKSLDAYVFAPYNNGAKPVRDIYYKSYSEFRRVLEDHGLGWFDTYHCRHFWFTSRLKLRKDLVKVAQAGGNSRSEILRTYNHMSDELASCEVNAEEGYSESGFGVL